MKKIISLLLVSVLLLSLAACGKGEKVKISNENINVPDKKVVIMVAPEAQYPEDYNAAKALAVQYPDKVIVNEYADSRVLVAGDPEIMKLSEEAAARKDVGAIIYARATQFTANAISAAKRVNNDIITIAVEPERNYETVTEKADLVLCADWGKYAGDIVEAAAERGAEYFLCFSFDAHMGKNPLYSQLRLALESKCEENGIEFVYDSSFDTNNAGGIETARLYVREAVARHCNPELSGEMGTENIVLFSTDSAVQQTLADIADKNGLIYICPSFPTAYNGVCELYDTKVPEKISDTDKFVTALKEAMNGEKGGSGRFSVYNYPLATDMLRGALAIAFDMLTGKTGFVNFNDRVPMRLIQAADDKKFSVELFPGEENVYECYAQGFEELN